MHILITRPKNQTKSLCLALQQLKHTVSILACIIIEDLSDSESHLYALKNITQADTAIFLSANAVHYSLPYWPQHNDIDLFAVGPATAEALSHYGKSAKVPPSPSSEGLLEMPGLQASAVASKNISLFSGLDPKPLLANTLRKYRANITQAFCYQRRCPAVISDKHAQELINSNVDAIICTSSATLKNLVSIVPEALHPWLKSKQLIVISDPMQKLGNSLGFQDIHCIENPLEQTLVDFFTNL